MDSKRNKQDDPPPPLPAPAAATSDHDFRRNWSELPELALHSISRRLLSVPDFLSFSSVCTSWNSTSDPSTSFPPLLLLPVLPTPPPLPANPNPNPFDLRRRCRSHHHPSRFLLQTPEEEEPKRRSFRSKIPSETLALPCLGCTDGCLVFLSAHNNLLILADAFSGSLRRAVFPPGSPRPRIALSLGADLLLLASDSVVLSYRPQTDTWSQLDHGAASLAAFGENQVYSIDPGFNRIVVIEFTPVRSTPTGVSLPQLPLNSTLCRDLGHRLVACGGDLLLLRVRRLSPARRRLDVFRLDPGASAWAEVEEGLGDWCLFLDAVGSSATACPRPARWGGRSNCVYVTGPGCDSWVAVPLDGDRQFVISDSRGFGTANHGFAHEFVIGDDNIDGGGHEFNLGNQNLVHGFFMANHDRMRGTKAPRWPSPVWVYPSTLRGRKR
ncbi:Uncharacterized protein M6B38_224290 [Iris pallida]|uniref:KIB1-4 beta-propeller domain-containing protein n=1 Tax=Iris pallida TaxID=29817 RepID=A0AAX6DVD4_IRIPA|nr:Uncharacterized protein M6B38_224290 [Iris pallida]